ncbi:hypothetical protein QEN19_002025 [Hanseniaspora menglaensis]
MASPMENSYFYLNDTEKLDEVLLSLGYDEDRAQSVINAFKSRAHETRASGYGDLKNKAIGIIGYGAMGKMYAKQLSQSSWMVNVCDLPENYETNKKEIGLYNKSGLITLFKDYIEVIKNSYFIMFCTESNVIGSFFEAVEDKSIFENKIISGQSSSKTIEVITLLKHTQKLNTDIITLHSMHGPNVPSKGQSLALIPVRLNNVDNLHFVDSFTDCFESDKKFLTFIKHDKTTANTQGLTHCAFINMGKAWYLMGKYPWLYDNNNTNPLEVFKVNLTFRIYGNPPHVYSNLAMMNPYSINAIKVFSKNCTLINKMITDGSHVELFNTLISSYNNVFQNATSLSVDDTEYAESGENTHLSLLALLKTWSDCGIDPISDKALGTPLYKLLLISVLRLFSNKLLLSIATKSTKYSLDDQEYVKSVEAYSTMISSQDRKSFNKSFQTVVEFFKGDDMEVVKQKAQKMILELNE